MKKIKVLIVDDSAIVRKILSEELSKDPTINVVGTAADPYIARDKILKLEPDLITLDIEMPKMDGLTFLKKVMKYHPLPVIIISSLTNEGSYKALECLRFGAVDVLGKPGGSYSVGDMKNQLIQKVKSASKAFIKKNTIIHSVKKVSQIEIKNSYKNLIAIGASTGGTEAIKEVLLGLPNNLPGIVITQHMPPFFTKSFADRLNDDTDLNVKEAKHHDRVTKGGVLIAPGGYHMIVKKDMKGYYVEIKDGPMVNYQKPAVDIMFKSIATVARKNVIGVILTGMGKDGSAGMLKMKESGAYNIAQDENSCVVFGMPKEAIKLGAVDKILPIDKIATEIVSIFL